MDVKFVVGESYPVDVTHINNPKSFYVRHADVKDCLPGIEKPGSPIPAGSIENGQKVIYMSNVLGKYVRGELFFVNPVDGVCGDCDIFAIDYGSFDNYVPMNFIHTLDPKAMPDNQRPPLAVHCQLYLCEPKGETFTEKVIEDMKYFVGEKTATITVVSIEKDKLVVELRTVDCPRDVATMMGLLHYTTFLKEPCTVNRLCLAKSQSKVLNYKHKELKVGDVLHVRVQSGSSVSAFYVAEINDYKKVIYDQASFSMYCRNRKMQNEDVVPGTPCAVKLNTLEIYERAIIKEILEPNSKARLKLVDLGKDVESQFAHIRSVKSECYFMHPILAIFCSTDEGQVWQTGLPTFLYPGYEFGIKIVAVGNGFEQPHKVDIYPLKMLKWH